MERRVHQAGRGTSSEPWSGFFSWRTWERGLGDAGRFLPGLAAHWLAQASQAGTNLAPLTAAALLVAYAVVAAGLAMLRMARIDVAPA